MVEGSAAQGSVLVHYPRKTVPRAQALLALALGAWVIVGGLGWALFTICSMLI